MSTHACLKPICYSTAAIRTDAEFMWHAGMLKLDRCWVALHWADIIPHHCEPAGLHRHHRLATTSRLTLGRHTAASASSVKEESMFNININ